MSEFIADPYPPNPKLKIFLRNEVVGAYIGLELDELASPSAFIHPYAYNKVDLFIVIYPLVTIYHLWRRFALLLIRFASAFRASR